MISRGRHRHAACRGRLGAIALSFSLTAPAMAERFHLLIGVDARRWPGVARQVAPQPGPGFPNNFYDGDRLAGTSDVGPVIPFAGVGTPMYQPNEFGCMSFTLRRGSVPFPPNQIPLMGIDFLGGPLLDLDGDPNDGSRSLVPVAGRTAAEIPGSTSFIELTLDTTSGAIYLDGFDATGTNEGGPGISAEVAVTLTTIAGTQPDGSQTGPINPAVDVREGSLIPFAGSSGTLRGVYQITDMGFELWQDTLLANSSTAGDLGTFQFMGEFRGWVIERDPATGDFPTVAGQGLGTTLWPLVDASQIGQQFETASGPSGQATISDGFPGDVFTAPGNGGLALAQFGGDLGGYFDQIVAPRIHPLSDRFVYLESAGFGINNSSDPIYLDSVAYDVVIVAESAPIADLADFAAFQCCFSGGAGGVPAGCDLFDFDSDLDVDLDDYRELHEMLVRAR